MTAADVAQTSSRSSLAVTATTYRSDFDGNNRITAADVVVGEGTREALSDVVERGEADEGGVEEAGSAEDGDVEGIGADFVGFIELGVAVPLRLPQPVARAARPGPDRARGVGRRLDDTERDRVHAYATRRIFDGQ